MSRRTPTSPSAGQYVINFDDYTYESATPPRAQKQEAAERETQRIADNALMFMSMGSGSSGNCSYIGTREGGILIDAGVREDDIVANLEGNGIPLSKIRGIVLTHDHADHVRSVYKVLRKNRHMRLFCTNKIMTGLLRRHGTSKLIKDYHVPIFKEIPFKIGSLEITAFDVPHDGIDNMGFSIEYGAHRFVLATDMGEIRERCRFYMSRANYIVIEANYDPDMLRLGRYPEYLKARIRTANGHMQNEATAQFLSEIINPELTHVFLCHLSNDNNTPEKAVEAVRKVLEAKGVTVGGLDNTLADRGADIRIGALPRYDASRLFVFRK